MILELEKQVCSLESAKRLKELGTSQNSFFHWFNWDGFDRSNKGIRVEDDRRIHAFAKGEYIVASAYTGAELGEILRKFQPKDNKRNNLFFAGINGCTVYSAWERTKFGSQRRHIYEDKNFDNEAEARAKLLIYLLENKLMEIKTCQ